MNKNKLRNIIELVVRKEVKKQLSEIFINEEKKLVYRKQFLNQNLKNNTRKTQH